MTVSELERKIRDIFSFILLACPNFPPETKTTAAREFDELTELIHAVLEGTRSDSGKQWLRMCLQEVQQSRSHYESGDKKMGMHLIQRAEEHFNSAFSKKATTARFVVGESGAALDEKSGFPQ